ncbi:hypothetical protein GCM10008027_39620 [Pseudoalteromonas gelatinilytica]|uniref:Uncharacterized protein n=1 Tax=Pseudoalteromonas gelatinilytica TaxID=1703256 RepID=A0ABQ1U5I7_9GAMM|nr:hypothetical protein GCM10008027_39620 [Pseudoalteromonas profundi]
MLFVGSLMIFWLGAKCKTRQASVTPTFDVGVKFISRDGFIIEIRYQKSDFLVVRIQKLDIS